MALQAYGKRVIVEPAKAESKKGAIIVPTDAQKRPLKGKVLSVGTLDGDVGSTLKVGDTVYYAAFSGTEIEQGDAKVLVLSQDDILATE